MLAAAKAPKKVLSLVLFEPAVFSVARGRANVEAHVAALNRVFDDADNPIVSDEDFSRRFALVMGMSAPDVSPQELRESTLRLRSTAPPWHFEVDASIVSRIPTLVCTGGNDRIYSEVAEALDEWGAEHVVVSGDGHRPQNDERCFVAVQDFWSRLIAEPNNS